MDVERPAWFFRPSPGRAQASHGDAGTLLKRKPDRSEHPVTKLLGQRPELRPWLFAAQHALRIGWHDPGEATLLTGAAHLARLEGRISQHDDLRRRRDLQT